MAEYVQPNINVSISEDCFEEAYYIHFGYFHKDSNGYITKAVFNKRYRIDSSGIRNTFPNLYSNSSYNKTNLKLNEKDSFLGSKVVNNETTVVSMIYSNEFFKEDPMYKLAMITGKSTESIPEIDIPYSYRYTELNMHNNRETVEMVSKIIKAYDNTKWLYLIDCQWISNIWCSYVIHFYIQQAKYNESIKEISLKLHTIREDSHRNDISDFANSIESQKILSHFISNNSLQTTFNKMNGLMTVNPMQHRLVFCGTPYGYTADKFETVSDKDWEVILKGESSYYTDLIDIINDKKMDGSNEFGNKQINKITFDKGSYEKEDLQTEDDYNTIYNKFKQNQIMSEIFSLFLNEYQIPTYGIVLAGKGFEVTYDNSDKNKCKLIVNCSQLKLFGDNLETLDADYNNKFGYLDIGDINTSNGKIQLKDLDNNNHCMIWFDSESKLFKLDNNTLRFRITPDAFKPLKENDNKKNLIKSFKELVFRKYPDIMNNDNFDFELNLISEPINDLNNYNPDQLIKISFLYYFNAISYIITEMFENEENSWIVKIDYVREKDISKVELDEYIDTVFISSDYDKKVIIELTNKYYVENGDII